MSHPAALAHFQKPADRLIAVRRLLMDLVQSFCKATHRDEHDRVAAASLTDLLLSGVDPQAITSHRDAVGSSSFRSANVVRKYEDNAITRLARSAYEAMSDQWSTSDAAVSATLVGGDYELVEIDVSILWPATATDTKLIFERRLLRATANNLTAWRGSHNAEAALKASVRLLYGGDLHLTPRTDSVSLLEVRFPELQADEVHEFAFVREQMMTSPLAGPHDWILTPVVPVRRYSLRLRFPGAHPRKVSKVDGVPRWLDTEAVQDNSQQSSEVQDDPQFGEYHYAPGASLQLGRGYGLRWYF